ncbi:MAG: hypothetical protein ACREFE_20215 [Limisphaerales bacterium]
MRHTIIILACLAFGAYAITRRSGERFAHLKGWEKLFGLIAVVLVVLILMNPDFLALGLLGDATFFDVLVMALSLQMLGFVQLAWRYVVLGFTPIQRFVNWRIYAISTVLFFTFADIVSTVQKVVHRISS